MPFEKVVKAIREQLNITQEQLAHELNIICQQLIVGEIAIHPLANR